MGSDFRLGEKCIIKSSKRIFAREYVEKGIPFWRSKDVIDKALGVFNSYDLFISKERFEEIDSKFGSPKKDDLLISSVGNRSGQPYVVEEDEDFYFKDGNILWMSNFEGINPRFLAYWLKSELGQSKLASVMIGSAQKALTIDAIRNLDVHFPSEAYQNKVVDILLSLDKKITLNRQTNQTLEKMAQTLFKSWFVDCDPVFDNLLAKHDFKLDTLLRELPSDFPAELLAKAEKRLNARLAAAVQKEPKEQKLNDAIHPHFPSEFEHNEKLGWIPKGWEASTSGDEFSVKGGSTPSTKSPDFWDGGCIHWTSPKDLSGNDTKVILDTSRKITEKGLEKITSGLLPVDTVLMSSRAPVGYLALAKIPLAINQGYIAIPNAKSLSPEYTIQWLDSVMDEIKSISGGTTFAEISKRTFKGILIVIPNEEAIGVFTANAKAFYERITANVKETKTLTETRDYLLPKLISGEIDLTGVAHD